MATSKGHEASQPCSGCSRGRDDQCCVADGGAPPERFDHICTLTSREQRRETPPNFLTGTNLTTPRGCGQVFTRRASLYPAFRSISDLTSRSWYEKTFLVGKKPAFFDIHKSQARRRSRTAVRPKRLLDQDR